MPKFKINKFLTLKLENRHSSLKEAIRWMKMETENKKFRCAFLIKTFKINEYITMKL